MSTKLAALDLSNRKELAETLRRAKDDHLARAAHAEPIAVVGIACRFPGGATTPDRLWAMLMAGRGGVGRVPGERFVVDDYYDPDPSAPGAIISDRGAFLTGVDQFDAAFFGVSPREARRLDPQHRLLLEVAWEALENAGLTRAALRELNGGVFVGLMGNDYFSTVQDDYADIDAYTSTGTHYSFAANRLSFHLDLHGPSIAIDTACSSSLVAVHQACLSLRARECDLAIAAGCNLILSPALSISYSKWGMLSPDGCCKTFDAAANGFVRGEGVGVAILKRLDSAIEHGDPILAVVRGSAVNQDGATSVITAPSGLAQQAVIRRALKVAGVEAARVGYVETHGTGTSLGDPIEVEALNEVYGRAAGGRACTLGAVKTNVGHLEGAAGIAGFLKAVLAVHRGAIPPNLNFQRLNPLIRLEGSRLRLAHAAEAWSDSAGDRFAAVSSFGAGGTNAHVVLQGHAAPAASAHGAGREAPHAPVTVCLSAKSAGSLVQQATRLGHWLRQAGERHAIADIAYTALRRRDHFEHRVAFSARSTAALAERLDDFVAGRAGLTWCSGTGSVSATRPVFVFSGQGSQWAGMGRELLTSNARFAAEIAAIDAQFIPLAGWSIAGVLGAAADSAAAQLATTEVAQPCLFALQLALVASLDELAIRPAAVVGHSVGEIAAACVAGLLDRDAAIALVYHRARLMQQLTGRGKMAVVGVTEAEAEARLRDHPGLAIAAINGPRSVVLAGEAAPLGAVVEALAGDGVFTRMLPVDYAFHSPQIDAIAGAFHDAVVAIFGRGRMAAPRLPMISTATGAALDHATEHAAYWAHNLRRPVAFARAIGALVAQRHDVFLEIGAHPVLHADLRATFQAHEVGARAIATLRRGQPQDLCLEAVPAGLYAAGVPPEAVPGPDRGALVALPNYAWDHRSYWVRTARSAPGWVYDLSWDDATEAAQVPRGAWWIAGDPAGLAGALGERLSASGERVHYHSAATLCARLAESDDAPDAIVYAPACASPDDPQPDRQAEDDCAALLAVVHALDARRPARLWIATAGAQCVSAGEPVNPFAAPLWGLGRGAALEAAHHRIGLIDLPLAWSSDDVARAADAMRRADAEDQLAIREARCRALRLRRAAPPADRAAPGWPLDPDALYVVTGGTRGLGLATARRLVERGARHLALIGRRPVPPRAQWPALAPDDAWSAPVQTIRELEDLGAEITSHAADVADDAALAAVFAELARQPRPIKGVVHAAGISREIALAALDRAGLAEHLAPKLAGAWALHRLTLDQPLGFFVMFSSAAAVWGSAGLAAYAAANEFLSGLAAHRRARGLPALSVCWGMWDADGMANEHRDSWGRLGIRAMAPERALGVLEDLVAAGATLATVADVAWTRFRPVYESRRPRPLLAALDAGAPAASPSEPRAPAVATASVRGEIERLPRDQQRDRLLGLVRDTAAAVLQLEAGRVLDADRGLFAMGFDSLTAVELATRLSHLFDRPYNATLIFDHPSLRQVRDFVLEDCFGWAASPAPGDHATGLDSLLAQVESLDDDEAARLLADERAR